MRAFLLAICTLLVGLSGNAQSVGINTTTPAPSAALDITSTEKGVLVPRMTEAQRSAISSPATGLLVFQNDATGGFWFYNGTSWQALGGTPAKVQDNDANTSIEVEKTANDDLIRFSLGGTEHFRMNKGTLEVINTGGSVFMGRLAGLNEIYDGGNHNVGIGDRALQFMNGGYNNVGVGYQSLFSNANGVYNAALGSESLRSNDGELNVGLGAFAGVNNTTGIGNVFIGYSAGADELGSNKLYIANSGTPSPLILGDFSSKKLTVNDSLQSKYFTMTNGAADGYVLRSDASGRAAWAAPAAETDPKVGSLNNNFLPKWNGTTLENTQFFDNGTKTGIGTSTPKNKLDVAGGLAVGAAYAGVSSAPDHGAIIQGNLGIGTTSPLYPLTVSGSLKAMAEIRSSSIFGTDLSLRNTNASNAHWTFTATGPGNNDGDGKLIVKDKNFNTRFMIDSTGNIGIGTVSPAAKLDISGSIRTDGLQLPTGATDGYILKTDADGNASWIDPASYAIASTWTPNGTDQYSALSGNVGIGTTTPANKLDISGNAVIGSAYTNVNSTAPNDGLAVQGTLNVGMPEGFTNIDYYKFLVYGDIQELTAFGGTNSLGTWHHMENTSGGGQWDQVVTGSANSEGGGHFLLRDIQDVRMIVKKGSGNVGIGTVSPSEKLDVNGKAKAVQLQMTTGAANGYVLKSDAAGNATWADPATLPLPISTKIEDADGNTKIDVEETPDEDLVRFHIGGINHFTMNSGRLEVSQTGASVIIGDGAGFGDDFNNRGNTYIGDGAGRVNYGTGSNVVLGSRAMNDNETGAENVAIGANAIENNVAGNQNTVLGRGAGANSTGSKNVFLGYQAGANEMGSEKLYIDNSNTATPLLQGDFLNDKLTVNGSLGVGNVSPASTLEVSGSMGLTVKGSLVAGNNHPDATGGIWIYTSGTGTITLPSASDCPNRMYIVANKTGATRNISSFTNLSGNAQSTIANAASFWLVSDGAGWQQIK